MFVVFLKDYEQRKDLVTIVKSDFEAQTLCDTLNLRCGSAFGLDYDEIMDFAKQNNLKLDKSMVKAVSDHGSWFHFEEVSAPSIIDYSVFNASWDESNYDACTSDVFFNDDTFFELEPVEFDYHFDYEMGCSHYIDLKHVNQHKLEKFNKESNQYKWYDPKIAHPDVRNKVHWYDPIHTFAHNHGYHVARNHVVRIINKMAKHHCEISKIRRKLLSIKEYKKSWMYKECIDNYIEAMYDNDWWFSDYMLPNHVLRDGVIWNKEVYNAKHL
ncbi:hypothetical protein HYQ22_gp125 [Acinetobacter phage vB_AbaM_Kimel]|uniref:Uncharacterized protein n=3 Tax=Lazarusvirus kimel TaxID=2843635 RepID=A0A6B9LZ87_9CAUD|nr:hypothetical protein HYQ22_gp125 [Acinetobacter phage vB_AbaM_Kimel]QHB48280.1 hypothetical protein Kimel_125 [Acinetobacter phage vB_AbaM_Kimel]QKE55823.1 hypothetical protein Octan_121 [Acinetobacter phage Octan]QNO11242.1 hypothetical protein Meroveus_121 [Acinetobacter phage Meroveus]